MHFETDQYVEKIASDHTNGRQGQVIREENGRCQVRWFFTAKGGKVSFQSKDGSLKTWVAANTIRPLTDLKYFNKKGD